MEPSFSLSKLAFAPEKLIELRRCLAQRSCIDIANIQHGNASSLFADRLRLNSENVDAKFSKTRFKLVYNRSLMLYFCSCLSLQKTDR